jgi:hypothetical protein
MFDLQKVNVYTRVLKNRKIIREIYMFKRRYIAFIASILFINTTADCISASKPQLPQRITQCNVADHACMKFCSELPPSYKTVLMPGPAMECAYSCSAGKKACEDAMKSLRDLNYAHVVLG